MKTLKFKDFLAKKILAGDKITTWRLFDDKDLTVGDKLTFINSDTGEEFAKANIVEINTKNLGELEEADFEGHEKYKDQDDMLAHYRNYYGNKVNLNTEVKMIKFKLVNEN